MRLIDADSLNEFILPVLDEKCHNDKGMGLQEILGYNRAIKEIKEQAKTSYDLEGVLEKLDDEKSLEEDIKTFNKTSRMLSRHWNECVDICKEIVREGVM